MNPFALLGLGWALMAVLMVMLWWIQRRRSDAGIVDVGWAAGIGLLAIGFALLADGDPFRRALGGGLAAVWSVRLAAYLLVRVIRLPEDSRYRLLRESWSPNTQRNFFLFFQLQASWSVLFALPILAACLAGRPGLDGLDMLGLAIWAAGMIGESIADRQLFRFRTDPANEGRVCRVGLWRWSRHPNYFFEWLQWWAYVAIGAAGPWGWVTLLGPAVMLYFLFRITGIPPTEERLLARLGDAYRDYQRSTSVFVPLPLSPAASGRHHPSITGPRKENGVHQP